MRVLFFIEPVIFRSEPDHLAAHLPWARLLEHSITSHDGKFGLVSNPDVCAAWAAQQPTSTPTREYFAIDPFDPLIPFSYRRDLYAGALFGGGEPENPVKDALRSVRDRFRPDLVVMTSQNAYARRAFEGLPILSIEKAPLPRHGQPQRMSFDLGGHQTDSFFESKSSRIKGLLSGEREIEPTLQLIRSLQEKLQRDPRFAAAAEEMQRFRDRGRIAILATQPPDWVTYDGSFQRISVEELLCLWEEQLPPGWIGVPTYHAGYRLSPSVEAALCRSRKRLAFLPPQLSQGITEVLLTLADGVVSISSTISSTGLLFGKRVVATGRCPFNAWCSRDVSQLSQANPLSPSETASLLAFLTNRYSWLEQGVEADPRIFWYIAHSAVADRAGSWLLDFTDWSPAGASRHFELQ